MAGEVVRGKDFLLMDSDILCDPAAVVAIAHQEETALALNRHECGEEEIKVIVDADNHITEINKTCNPKDAIGESVGIERFTATYCEALYKELEQMIQKEGLHRDIPSRWLTPRIISPTNWTLPKTSSVPRS